jgi:DNA polymerase (family 10)
VVQLLLQAGDVTPTNAAIADTLRRYAAVLAIQGADRFKLKAYRRAVETIEASHESIGGLVRHGSDLTELPGIGKAISQVIDEVVRTGRLARLEKTLAELPTERAELAAYSRLDAKNVTRIYKKLGIKSVAELREALDAGTIRNEFGARLDFHVRRGLDDRPRHLLWSIEDLAEQIENYLRKGPGVSRVSAAGSLRRKQDTVGDLNFVLTGKSAARAFNYFAQYGAVQSSEKRKKGERIFTLSSGITVSLQWTPEADWGLSLLLATGSPSHLRDLEAKAKEKRLSLSRPTLARKKIRISDEEPIYSALGLEFIPPELREGRGEVAAAAAGELPKLVTAHDLRGDLHMHTTESDGANSIDEMVRAAQSRGYEYIAITDHSQSLKITNGLSEQRLLKHIKAIDKLNGKLRGFRILKSAEVDILEDGRLDYSSAVLKELDFTVCSIHSRFALNREQQTQRVMRAMDNRYFTILGHATGRLLIRREGYEIDMERIIRHAKMNGRYFEINSSPDRLDLSDENAKLAKDAGVLIAVNTDAHSIRELNFITAGINQARRAWLSKSDVVNTRHLPELLRLFRRN